MEETVDLPVAIEPVRPRRSILCVVVVNGKRERWLEFEHDVTFTMAGMGRALPAVSRVIFRG
jgi:hypothetical protein